MSKVPLEKTFWRANALIFLDIMQRTFRKTLEDWSAAPDRRPLLVRGARQVGKTYVIREFLKSKFSTVIEISFEDRPELKAI